MKTFITAKRKAKGLTQLQLAQLAGVTKQYIYLIESGKRRPSYEVAKELASILEVEWMLFFESIDDKNAS